MYLKQPNIYPNECRILESLFTYKSIDLSFFNTTDGTNLHPALKPLIAENIVRMTSSPEGKIIHFHSSKHRLAMEHLKKREELRLAKSEVVTPERRKI